MSATGEHEQQQCGQQPPSPAGPEREHGDASGVLPLGQQQTGDQVPGQHEERVDTEEPAACPGHPAVEGQHRQHRQCPDAVERGDTTVPRQLNGPGGDGAWTWLTRTSNRARGQVHVPRRHTSMVGDPMGAAT